MADRLTGLGGGEKASSRILPTKCKEALFSQRGHPEGGSSWGNGDRESHATKLCLSCLRDMWVVLESSPGWGRDLGVTDDVERWLRQGQPERRRRPGLG